MMMMMMPVMKLQMSAAQQNTSPQPSYPAAFPQNAQNQMPVVPLHQMGYPTYPPMGSSAPNRTPPVPGEQELDPERAKWKAAWEEEENKQRWAEWDEYGSTRRPRRRRTRRVEPIA